MRLFPKEAAKQLAEQWFEVPTTYELIDAGYYRSDKNSAPFYTLEMKWTRGGRPYLTKRGLVSSDAIDLTIDALTGRIVSYINRSLKPNRKLKGEAQEDRTLVQQLTMDEDTSRVMHAAALQWIQKLDLPIEEPELVLQRGVVRENEEYKLEYRRSWNGFWLFEYQSLSMTFNKNEQLVSMYIRWDDIDFELPPNYLSESDIRQRMSTGDLYLLPTMLERNPSWVIKPVSYDAVTGELIAVDEGYESIRTVVCTGSPRGKSSKFKRKPILSEDAFELLRLLDDITDVSPLDSEPFAPFLTEAEEESAIQAACQFIENYGNEGEVFILVRKRGEPLAEVMINRVGLRFFRGNEGMFTNRELMTQDGIAVWLDRRNWEVINFMERSELREAFGIKPITDKNLITPDEAWEKLRDKLTVRLGFRLHDYDLKAANPLRRRATLEYRVTCDWRCNARTGEVFHG